MQFASIQRIVGILLVLSSLTMVPPVLVSLIYGDSSWKVFLEGSLSLIVLGALCWYPVRHVRRELRIKDGFIVVVACWLVLGLCSAVPFFMSAAMNMSLTDSVFEAMSGLTTTGATVLTNIDSLQPGFLYYRQQLQWLGGMGIIVLAVAILPMLRIGGMQLYRAETPGPMKDSKLTPRIAETAKALWYLYLTLTIVCAAAYWMAGMKGLDAIGHAFSTVAIGGFSTHDASIGFYDSAVIESICMLFMFLSGINYALHFVAWRRATINPYLGDPELKAYIGILAFATIICTLFLFITDTYDGFLESLRYGMFQVISIGTTTGFATDSFLPVARVAAADAAVAQLRRCLRRLHRRRHESGSHPAAVQAGHSRDYPAGAPQLDGDRQAGPAQRAGKGDSGRLGLLLALRVLLHGDVAGADGLRHRSGHRRLCRAVLPQQPGPGTGRSRRALRRPGTGREVGAEPGDDHGAA